jgi:hypothetical protein
MPTPRVLPDRVLTAAERQARRHAKAAQRLQDAREALEAVIAARTIAQARGVAVTALAQMLVEPR